MADRVTILGVHRIVRPRFEGEHPVRHVAFPPLGQSKLHSFRSWRYIIPYEARPAEVRDLSLHGVPWDKWTVPHPKTAPRLRFDFRLLATETSRADQVSPFRDRDSNHIASGLPDPVGVLFDLDNMPGQHVLGSTNRHLRLVLKRPRTRCRSQGERSNDSTYGAYVAHGSSLLTKDCLARSACPILSATACTSRLTAVPTRPHTNNVARCRPRAGRAGTSK